MANIEQVMKWMKNLNSEQKIKRPEWSHRYIYLHEFKDGYTTIGMCKNLSQEDFCPMELTFEDLKANDWQLIIE